MCRDGFETRLCIPFLVLTTYEGSKDITKD
jgi:hypothetical protein